MRSIALAATSLALLAFGSAAEARPAKVAAPVGLHGFLLRADEPTTASFPRTPAFSWAPVAGAKHYEFQLATSSMFRDSGLVYTNTSLTTPVASPPLTLPWITGQPHALWARVRAVLPGATTPWSTSYGFDIVPPAAPTPLPAAPGLLRWTPTEGAEAYQVWLEDVSPPGPPGPPSASGPWTSTTVYTNVLDEREIYTFHQSRAWTGPVHWRVRAIRIDNAAPRENSLPAVSYGPWSSTYTNTNPPVTNSPIRLVGTVSDVTSDGSSGSQSHSLMPGFTFTGNSTVDGSETATLYRVYVFTDAGCLNTVFTSPVIGSPAYAPRPYGAGPALPTTSKDLANAATGYLGSHGKPDGQPDGTMADGVPAIPNETLTAAAPTTTSPSAGDTTSGTTTAPATGTADPGSTGGSAGSTDSSGSTGSTGSNGTSADGSGTPLVSWPADPGAPVDLWDTQWPEGGYYWTVVPVAYHISVPTPTSLVLPAAIGSKTLTVASAEDIAAKDEVRIGSAPDEEIVTVTAVNGNVLTLESPLAQAYIAGDPVGVGDKVTYSDLELPQAACAAGRVMRFGKASTPTTYADGHPYLSGLSVSGRLITGQKSSSGYYGTPLVAWQPAGGATVYQVQWSKTRYPFAPQTDPATKAAGIMTSSTSAVLPMKPGTWWYRVRGFDYSLPAGAQAMSWSDPIKVVIAHPKFAIVADKTKH